MGRDGGRRRSGARGFFGALALSACGAAVAAGQGSDDGGPTGAPRPPPRVLTDTAAGFLKFSAPPAGNGVGALVFHAVARTGREGIYYSHGGAPVPVVNSGADVDFATGETYGLVSLGPEPGVNSLGFVAFHAVLDQGSGVLSRAGPFGAFHFVADSGEAFRTFSGRVRINQLGDVAFHAAVDPRGHPDHGEFAGLDDRDLDPDEDERKVGPPARWTRHGMQAAFDEGLFVDDGNDLLVVGGTHADFADVSPRFELSASGALAYRCWTAAGVELVVWDDGYAVPFAIARTGAVYSELGDPACNERGDVVFTAVRNDGVPVVLHARNARVIPSVLAEGSDTIRFRPGLAVDGFGHAYFVAEQTGRDTLIVRDEGGGLRPLLRSGDPVPGLAKAAWVGSIRVGSLPFLRPGTLAVLVELEPEGQAILLVDH